jgi:hypothetical protein
MSSSPAAEQAVQGIQFSAPPIAVQLRSKHAGGCQSEPALEANSPGT